MKRESKSKNEDEIKVNILTKMGRGMYVPCINQSVFLLHEKERKKSV